MALRSAMKHSSRPGTPQVSPSPRPIPLPHTSSDSGISPPYITLPDSGTLAPPTHLQPQHVLSPVPATPGYTSKVSFDTFENQSASMFSYTLRVKSEGYRRTRSTRVFLCAASPDESGREALDWTLEALVQDGDELIVFRGVDEYVLG